MLRRITILLCCLWPLFAMALPVEQQLSDPAAEARAREIARSLRCLVCQNESIDDSNADLAGDLRQIVRERVTAGDSDDAVRAFIVARYGDWVLLKPPFKIGTVFLWLGPFVLLVIAAGGVVLFYRRQRLRLAEHPAPLSADEAGRLAALLGPSTGNEDKS